MRYRPNDLLALVRTPPGRRRFLGWAYYAGWPVFATLASVWRRTLLRRARVVCVVGSLGKTTTARAVATALGEALYPSMGGAWGHAAFPLLRARPGQRHIVVEVAIAGPGQMSRYPPILRPDLAVVTSIGSEHNRSLGTLERTRHEKAEMVRSLPATGRAILNGDDPNVRWMAGSVSSPNALASSTPQT